MNIEKTKLMIALLLIPFLPAGWGVFSNASAMEQEGLQGPAPQKLFSPSQSVMVDTYDWNEAPHRVILFQDVHNRVASQMNLAILLSDLEEAVRSEGKNVLVTVEGSFGPLQTDPLAAYPDHSAKKKRGEELVKSGVLLGEEYAAILNDPGRVKIVGIEDPGLYKKNVIACDSSQQIRNEMLRILHSMKRQLQILIPRTYPPEAIEVEEKRHLFEAGNISTWTTLRFLFEKDPAAMTATPQLKKAMELIKKEQIFDADLVRENTENILALLAENKETASQKALVKEAELCRSGEKPLSSYYLMLINSVPQDYDTKFLKNYQLMLVERESMSENILFEDVDRALEDAVGHALSHPEAKDLHGLLVWVEGQARFFNLSLSSKEWEAENARNVADFYVSWERTNTFLKDHSERLGIAAKNPSISTDQIKNAMAATRLYYTLARARDVALAQNFLKLMTKVDDTKTVATLIAGGFHTEGISSVLKREGWGYTIVRPKSNNTTKTKLDQSADEFLAPSIAESKDETHVYLRQPGAFASQGWQWVYRMIVNGSPIYGQKGSVR